MIKNKLSVSEMEELLALAGDFNGRKTVNVHHCKLGRSNDRCYITEVSNNGYIFYCHHCGKSGALRQTGVRYGSPTEKFKAHVKLDGEFQRRNVEKHAGARDDNDGTCERRPAESSIGKVQLCYPVNTEFKVARWTNTQAKVWILSKNFTAESIEKFSIGFINDTNTLVIPMWDSLGYLRGLQYRRFPTEEGKPKYITKLREDYDKLSEGVGILDYRMDTSIASKLFIVEDYLSACRIADSGYRSLPLYGTGIEDGVVNQLAAQRSITSIHVMLDNDNPEVRRAALRIRRRLEPYFPTHVTWLATDPKNYSNEALLEILETA